MSTMGQKPTHRQTLQLLDLIVLGAASVKMFYSKIVTKLLTCVLWDFTLTCDWQKFIFKSKLPLAGWWIP